MIKRLALSPLCKCGCGKHVKRSHIKPFEWNRFLMGHSNCKHGYCKEPYKHYYSTWGSMIKRCHNSNDPAFKYYGGRGTSVCDEWRNDFLAFYNYIIKHLGAWPGKGWTIDRYPTNDGNYEPGNIRWATWLEQANNRRNNKGTGLHGYH